MKTLIKILCLSMLWFSCEPLTEPEEEIPEIPAPDLSEICEYTYSDVDGSFESCGVNCEAISADCYHSYDLQVLRELQSNNSYIYNYTDPYYLLQIGEQGWEDGRLRSIEINNMSITYLPEGFCNLNCQVDVSDNDLCDQYQYDCYYEDSEADIYQAIYIGTQDISGCEGYSDYSGESYYDDDINILSDIKELNPSLSDTILLEIGQQEWQNGRLSILNLSSLGLVYLPESICNLNSQIEINVNNNQLCQDSQFDCIDTYEWGVQSGLDIMDCAGVCFGDAVEDVCGVCKGIETNADDCCSVENEITFTSCGETGDNLPSQNDCDTEYFGTELDGMVTVSAGIQAWTVQNAGIYTIQACGAEGGEAYWYNEYDVTGKGACMQGDFTLEAGEVLYILAGQQGEDDYYVGGGGGGTFVYKNDSTPGIDDFILAAGGGAGQLRNSYYTTAHGQTTTYGAGGSCYGNTYGSSGYGGSTYGSGAAGAGAGILSDGASNYGGGGHAIINGGSGGYASYIYGFRSHGGFGGGGSGTDYSSYENSGGGGGYSGGGAEGYDCTGGGGGSYNSGANQQNESGINYGNGYVIISCP